MAVVEAGHRHAHARARKSVPCECGADRAEGGQTIGARQVHQAVRSQWRQATRPKRAGSISRIFACGRLERASMRRYSVASRVLRLKIRLKIWWSQTSSAIRLPHWSAALLRACCLNDRHKTRDLALHVPAEAL